MNPNAAGIDGTRREFLVRASTALGLASLGPSGPVLRAASPEPAPAPGEDERIKRISEQAKRAGIGPFGFARTEHFLGVGNAPEGFRKEALEVSEALGRVFLKHMADRGFPVAFPADRMMVVVLKDSHSYGALVGEAPSNSVGGHFDLDADRLVVFDFRPGHDDVNEAERINTFTLVHETTHLLTFNTGLLTVGADPGKAVTEGLATYFEMWRRASRAAAGRVNRPRMLAIRDALQGGDSAIPLSRLLTEDGLFDAPETSQLAYGQAWLLMYTLLSSRSLQRDMVAYFDDLRAGGAKDRVKTFEKHLGSLDRLDERLRRETRSLLRELR